MAKSKRYRLNTKDWKGLLKVVIYSCGSAALLELINLLDQVDFGQRYHWLVPLVNTLAVLVKKFFSK